MSPLIQYTHVQSEHPGVLVSHQDLVLAVVSPDVHLHLEFFHVQEVMELLSVVVDG